MQHVTELLHERVQSLLIVVVYARVFEVLGHVDPVRIEQQAVSNAVNLKARSLERNRPLFERGGPDPPMNLRSDSWTHTLNFRTDPFCSTELEGVSVS